MVGKGSALKKIVHGADIMVRGSPEYRKRKAELKLKEEKAYREAFEKAKVAKARREGYRAGSTTWGGRIGGGLAKAGKGLGEIGDYAGGVSTGLGELFGADLDIREPRVRTITHRKPRQGQRKKVARRKTHRRQEVPSIWEL